MAQHTGAKWCHSYVSYSSADRHHSDHLLAARNIRKTDTRVSTALSLRDLNILGPRTPVKGGCSSEGEPNIRKIKPPVSICICRGLFTEDGAPVHGKRLLGLCFGSERINRTPQ